MGNRRFGRRPNLPPVSRLKSIPHRWLSCPDNGHPIHLDSIPNLYLIPMKSPLSGSVVASLGQLSSWTARKAVSKAQSLVSCKNPKYLAINVSAKHEIISQADWELVGAHYARIEVPSDYSAASVDKFCSIIQDELSTNLDDQSSLVCLVYCGCGLNRVGFMISAYLTKFGSLTLPEALKKCDESSPRLIYRQQPLDVLSDIFQTEKQVHGAAPDWVKLDEKVGPIGEIPLPLEKFNAIKKVSRKQASPEERSEILSLLAESVGDASVIDGNFPSFCSTLWNSQSLSLLRSKLYYTTFVPRGVRVFIVVSNDNRVYIVDASCQVWELRVKSYGIQYPAVASAYLVEEKKRAVVLTTDLFLLGQVKVSQLPLNERLAQLAHNFTKKLKMENPEQLYSLQFVFRPMTKISNSSKLKKDLSSLFVKCDGISFHEVDGEPLNALFLPINPSLILQFDYNGNDKAILYARAEQNQLEPVGVYIAPNPKFNGFDGRTNRFIYDQDKHEWVPVAVGHNDPPSTIKEVQDLLSLFQTNISYESIFKELDKIVVNID